MARLDAVPLPLFHAALRVAFQGQGAGARGAALQHEAFSALATAFSLLHRRCACEAGACGAQARSYAGGHVTCVHICECLRGCLCLCGVGGVGMGVWG